MVALCTVGCSSSATSVKSSGTLTNGLSPGPAGTVARRPDHVVLVIMENHSYADVIGSQDAPYIDALAKQGASFDDSSAVTHPSQPNYLALFSGSTQGVTDDSCPHTFSTGNLEQELNVAGDTFAGYSESLPSDGYPGCASGDYARKHSPWADFANVPASSNRKYSEFPSDYRSLPDLSFVIPNLQHDMHDGTVGQGDGWLKKNIDPYAQWARSHNSLLIVTWDEDDYSQNNQIPTLFVGAKVRPGIHSQHINHYSVLRMLEDLYDLPAVGDSRNAAVINGIWATVQ